MSVSLASQQLPVQQQEELINRRLKNLLKSLPANGQPANGLTDQKVAALQKYIQFSAATFASINDRREIYETYVTTHSPVLNDPFFWLWMTTSRPHYGYQPYLWHGHYHGGGAHHHGGLFGCCSDSRGGGGGGGQSDPRGLIAVCIVALILSDLVAIGGAIAVTSEAVDKVLKAKEQNEKYKQAEALVQSLQSIGPEQQAIFQALLGIGNNLQSIGQREVRYCTAKAVSTGLMATAGAGTVHVIVSAICAAALANKTGVAAVAALGFFKASISPPLLIAIAIIFSSGLLLFIATKYYKKREHDLKDAALGQQSIMQLHQLAAQLARNQEAYASYHTPRNIHIPGRLAIASAPDLN